MSEQAFLQSPKIPRQRLGCFAMTEGIELSHGEWTRAEWWFCANEVSRAFNIPFEASAIQFRAFTEPGPDRFKVQWGTAGSDTPIWLVEDEEGQMEEYYLDDDTEVDIWNLIKKRRKTWYVQVFYWV